jgi:hypothetical protein
MTHRSSRPAGSVDAGAGSAPGGPIERAESSVALPALEPDEDVLAVLRGIGAVMFLTSARLIVVRDGGERRPKTGLQSFPLETIRHVRLELGSPPSGRVAVWTATGQEAVSMFFDARSLDRAHQLLDVARPLIARHRRRLASGSPRSTLDPLGD